MDWQVEFNYKMAVCQLSPPLISYLPLRLSLLVFMIATDLNKPFKFLERSVVVILVYNLAYVYYLYIFYINWISMHAFGFRGNAYENIVHYFFLHNIYEISFSITIATRIVGRKTTTLIH